MTIRIRRYGRAAGFCLAFVSAAAPASALAEGVPQLDCLPKPAQPIATSDGNSTGGADSYDVAQFMDEAQAVGCRVAGPLPAGLSLLLGALIAMKRRRRFR